MKRNGTKIIATLGPETSSDVMIKEIFEAGADLFRLNFSHHDAKSHIETLKRIRTIAPKAKVIADLQGPKIRIGEFEKKEGILLQKNQLFTLDLKEEPGNQYRAPLPYPELFPLFKKGMLLFLNDGKIKLEIIEKTTNKIKTKILVAGSLRSRKGLNIPSLSLPYEAITEKDKKDLRMILKHDFDAIALSFVQKASDITKLRELLPPKTMLKLYSKIEKKAALEKANLRAIIKESDGIIIARGDLGIEMPIEKLPGLQKKLIKEGHKQKKEVIIATQMLESMRWAPMPTRAEAIDTANAAYEHASAILLSAETALGHYPIEAVKMASKLLSEAEKE